MIFRTPYNRENHVKPTVGGGDSMVRQSFADECDINQIVARYANSGQLPPADGELVYGDVSEIQDYKSCMDFVFKTKERLKDLPDAARELYAADPLGYFNNLNGAKDRNDLVALGLLEAKPPVEEPPVKPAATE